MTTPTYVDNTSEPAAWFDVEEFLEQTQRQTERQLQQELARIEKQLDERDALHDSLAQELESKIEWYTDRLQTLKKRSCGKQEEKDHLKERIESFYRELREERRTHWRDKQQLEQDRRDILRELDSIQSDDYLRFL